MIGFGQSITLTSTAAVLKADLLFDNEEYSKAAELYKKAYKKTKTRELKSIIIFKQAECYRKLLNYTRAASYYKRAIIAKYSDVIIYLHYIDVLLQNKNYEEAEVQYKECLQLNPTDVLVYLRYADMLRQNENYASALEQYKLYMNLKPKDPRGYIGLSYCDSIILVKTQIKEKEESNTKRIQDSLLTLYSKKEIEPAYANQLGCISGDCNNGFGTFVDKEGTYKGEWKDGKVHGYGEFQGILYDYNGEYLNGKKHGEGQIKYHKNGAIKTGKWIEGIYQSPVKKSK